MPNKMLNDWTDEQRCNAKNRAGQRCGKPKMSGLTVCATHGGSTKAARAKSEVIREVQRMERAPRAASIRPIAASDAESRGDVALGLQIRRAIAWIRYCEDRIEELIGEAPVARAGALDEDPLTWGRTKREDIGASEFGGVNTTYAAGVGAWEEKLRWWSAHLAALTKTWINAGFEAKRLEMASRTLDVLERAIDGIVRDLGHNPRDAEIRAIVRKRLESASRGAEGEDGL